jgi:hypothetical protein
MRRLTFVFAAFVYCVVLLLPSFAFGKIEKPQAIYFCTKDIDALQSVAADNKYNEGFKNLTVYKKLNNEYHAFLRHCFFVFATTTKETDEILNLGSVKTYGYGSDDFATASKGGRSYPETDVPNKVISCVPIIKSGELTKDNDIYDKWTDILRMMDEEADKTSYNVLGHNCCTVAYKIANDIQGNITQIDPNAFNLYGLGITWGDTLGGVSDFTSSSVVKTISSIKNSLQGWAITEQQRDDTNNNTQQEKDDL